MKVVQCYWWNWNPALVNESDKLFCVLCSLSCAFSDFWFERLEFFFAIIFYAVGYWCWKLLNIIVFCLFVVRTKNFVKISNFSRIFDFFKKIRIFKASESTWASQKSFWEFPRIHRGWAFWHWASKIRHFPKPGICPPLSECALIGFKVFCPKNFYKKGWNEPWHNGLRWKSNL